LHPNYKNYDMEHTPFKNQKWLNTKQAADYLGISTSTLYHWVNEHKVRYHKLSLYGRLRFTAADLDDVVKDEAEIKEAKKIELETYRSRRISEN
jgi:excisionase family DNA binding protein